MLKISDEALKLIEAALKRGNSVEVKRESGRLVIVEIRRKVAIKENM